ncbi:uncharacterized protein FPRO_02159 [Fusarium proliferatum ET1]|uniref:Uncharacterized protein n=1 Tax=Fusarium proliferatum (strain ET1) TaxID=1227346 RepID=A0A1L7VDS9_FUSPR|nr:uncharacterized protein FPRO_02159 [Fusarium proliferatum ET1]CZR37580.1 uncharacterized protein FPRO_02159 [Fusarium proliferatum ET1]
MNDDNSDLFSWVTDDEDANHKLTLQSVAIRNATPLGQIRNGRDRSRLPLLQLAEWDETLAYDEQPLTCMHYLIEWKLKLNSRCISKDTEPDVILAPGAYWTKYLWSKVDKLAKKKLPANRTFHVDDTDIAVCVNYKGKADLNIRCDGLDVNWKMIERSPCGFGPHCWVDTVGKKYYKLKTHHLKALIEHMRLGNTVESHDNVPPDIRDLLYAKEEQNARPVNITNVMPTYTGHLSDDSDTRTLSRSAEGSRYAPKYLGIPEMHDVNVNKYCIWHCSKNANNVWKIEYKKACDLMLAKGLDLEQIRLDQDAQFFIDKGIKKGIAKR